MLKPIVTILLTGWVDGCCNKSIRAYWFLRGEKGHKGLVGKSMLVGETVPCYAPAVPRAIFKSLVHLIGP